MTRSLWIPGPLPSLNDMIAAAKGMGGRGLNYSRMKKAWTDTVWALALNTGMHLPGPIEYLASLSFHWVEKDRRRDKDNVAGGGRKLILDGLVKARVLSEDGWDQVYGWTDTFAVDKSRPGVQVTIGATGS